MLSNPAAFVNPFYFFRLFLIQILSISFSSKEANTYCYFGSPETENISPRADKRYDSCIVLVYRLHFLICVIVNTNDVLFCFLSVFIHNFVN